MSNINKFYENKEGIDTSCPTLAPFLRWGLDYIGPITPITHYTHNKCIIVAINYSTKWVDAHVVHINIANVTTLFLYESFFFHYSTVHWRSYPTKARISSTISSPHYGQLHHRTLSLRV